MKTLFIPYTKKKTILKSFIIVSILLLIFLFFFIYLTIDISVIDAGKREVSYIFVIVVLYSFIGYVYHLCYTNVCFKIKHFFQ